MRFTGLFIGLPLSFRGFSSVYRSRFGRFISLAVSSVQRFGRFIRRSCVSEKRCACANVALRTLAFGSYESRHLARRFTPRQ
jgi:hypothetical protein